MQENFKRIWNNKSKILEGMKNTLFRTRIVEETAAERLAICQSNVCGHYDQEGTSEKVILKGQPACSICGCTLSVKTRCMSCSCALDELSITPLWEAKLTQEEEDSLNSEL